MEETKSISSGTLRSHGSMAWKPRIANDNALVTSHTPVSQDIVVMNSSHATSNAIHHPNSKVTRTPFTSKRSFDCSSRHPNYPGFLYDIGSTTHGEDMRTASHQAPSRVGETRAYRLRELYNATSVEDLTSRLLCLTRLPPFKLRDTISDLKSATKCTCRLTDKKPQPAVDKASIKGPCDFRCISGGVDDRLQASLRDIETARILLNENDYTKTKLLRSGQLSDYSDCEGEKLRFAPRCVSLDNLEPGLATGSQTRGCSLRGGGGTMHSSAAKRDKPRNNNKPQSKISAPEINALRRNNISPHDSADEQAGLLTADDREGQVNDVLTGLWNKQYQTPSKVPDGARLNKTLWWFAGGKLAAGSKPEDVGSLREMQRVAKSAGDRPVVNGKTQPRGFLEECKYVLTDGRDSRQRKTARGNRKAGQSEEMPQPVDVRERDSVPQRTVEAASSLRPNRRQDRGREHQATDRTRSRSRTSTWSESSDSHSPAHRLLQLGTN